MTEQKGARYQLGPFSSVMWGRASSTPFYGHFMWGELPDNDKRAWWVTDSGDNNGMLYLFAPSYLAGVHRVPQGVWMLRLSNHEWDSGVTAEKLEDLWPVFITWKLTGVLEVPDGQQISI